MSVSTYSRSAFLGLITAVGVVVAAPAAYAARNAEAEQFTQTNATAALAALNAQSGPSQREQTFRQLMERFSDLPRIANYVLGRYSSQLRTDPSLRTAWIDTFRNYSFATYQTELDHYRGAAIRVTGSIERVPGQDVVVRTEMSENGQSRPMPVQWRLLKTGDSWRVVDVSLVLDGNEIWLAQKQQRDFLAMLDSNHGDIRALMDHVRQLTTSMRQQFAVRS